jgi:hypothetical protein
MRKKSSSKITTLSKNWHYRSLSVPDKVSSSMAVLKGRNSMYRKARATILLCNAIVYKDVALKVKFFVKENKQKLNPVFAKRLHAVVQNVLKS